MSLQHVVLFSFPQDLDAADQAEMRRQVEAWPAEIGGMTAIRLGRSPLRSPAWAYSHATKAACACKRSRSKR